MKIVHTEMELRASGTERLRRAADGARLHALARRLRLAVYVVVLVAAALLVDSLLLK
ncbi:hypothetical protein GRAN_2691 [Granulicella sibirica]|uniref:Uncharacterized protein n=2 Tax=Granulicella sibirica TaxID=2479048 RepID=A0A4V1L5I0_9BACT|nr:hypothetical protein GRAN_2691 [Granulicella sibirica]